MCDFKLYERVVCIAPFDEPGNDPRVGETVTIIYFDLEQEDGEVYIQLLEYPCGFDGEEQSFISTKFERPKTLPLEQLYNKNIQPLP